MINIFVLEDEILQQSRIETAILKILNEEQIKCRVFDVFGSSSQLLEAIEERGGHQLFFLDIEIKDEEKKGLEIAKEIRKKDPAATIVFVTTHSEFMPLTFKFKVSALDFIDKALGEQYFYERIKSAIDYTLASAGETLSQESFHLETSLSQIQVPLKKILYFFFKSALLKPSSYLYILSNNSDFSQYVCIYSPFLSFGRHNASHTMSRPALQ